MKLADAERWLRRHLERVEPLGDHLGPNLVQLAPRWRRNTARLDEFLAAAPRQLRWAVEFRDRSWLHDDTFEVLARHGAALCIHDLLDVHPWQLTTDWTYVRFHGPAATDRRVSGPVWAPPPASRCRAAERLAGSGNDVFAYFNNDYEGNAVVDATTLA